MPSGRSNASSLLRKVTSQLRGERVPIQTKEEDELAVYLQGLSQKTQQAKNVGFEEYGDISISSGADAMQTPRGRRSASPANSAIQPIGSGSKFLKKKKTEPEAVARPSLGKGVESDDEEMAGPGKEIVIQGRRTGAASTPKSSVLHPVRTSALDKASALANKITSRSGGIPLRRHRSGDSESDESVRGSDAGKRPGSADTSISRDNQRFLKSRKTVSDDVHLDIRSPSPQRKHQNENELTERMDAPRKSTKSKGEIVRTLGSMYLTSEEESLAEFIHGLSTSETSKKPQNLVAKKQQKWRKKSPSPVGRQNASPIHMSRSPSPFKNRPPSPFGYLSRSQSQDSDMLDSMASEMLDDKNKHDHSVSSDDNNMININFMDIDSLVPASPSPEPGKKRGKKSRPTSANKKSAADSTSIFKSSVPNVFKADRLTDSMVPNKKSEKAKKSTEFKSNLFESLGIQMADDLLDIDVKEERKEEVSVSEESEILTEKSEDRKKRLNKMDSESEIVTEIGSKHHKAPLKRQTSVDDSISERLNERSSMANIKLAYSSQEEDIETEAEYSESFVSESETVTASSRSKRTKRKSREESVSRGSKTSQSSRNHRREHKVVMEEKRVDISAADNEGKTHYWNSTQTGISVSGPFGLQYVDPTPVASHVISSDALEALTAYGPNMLALQDMMRSQLQLVSSFMEIQRRIYSSCMEGLKEDHQYTTLQDTQEFIRKNRKPRMSMDEALRLVDLEEKDAG